MKGEGKTGSVLKGEANWQIYTQYGKIVTNREASRQKSLM